jgi:hypothetical protein
MPPLIFVPRIVTIAFTLWVIAMYSVRMNARADTADEIRDELRSLDFWYRPTGTEAAYGAAIVAGCAFLYLVYRGTRTAVADSRERRRLAVKQNEPLLSAPAQGAVAYGVPVGGPPTWETWEPPSKK